jgi:predicted ATPase/DNA-binding SARP family transcriptional activator
VTSELTLLSGVSYRGREITGRRLRDLLALLASDLRAGCSAARLVEGLWPEGQPENPTKALQVIVSRIRSQLGPDVIASTPTGYRLALTEDQVDSSAILLSAAASARHARAGDHEAALAHAEAGAALWAAAAGDADDPVSALRAERAPAYRALGRARSLALSRLGRHEEAVETLVDLIREHPRDEEVLLELLRCEAATVGPSAALARYDAYRRELRDDLGTDPGSPLQALYQHLLQGEVPVVRHGVAYEPNPLLGRDGDLVAVANLLRTSRVTSIVGAGGLGKTRLAHVVSRQAEQRVVHLVSLAGVTVDDDVTGEVASVLGVSEARHGATARLVGPSDVLAGIVNVLVPGPVLLVLDNCEQVIRGVAELVRALVSMTSELRVLTTSRAPLGLSSESVYQLPELDLPTAVELFEQRAKAARPGADLPADAVKELCRHLDGLPLAVELAAARVRVMSVPEMTRRLDDRFALLRGAARDAPQRHQTLRAVVDWSWNLLEPAEQAAMRALSVFPGGFTAEAAHHLSGEKESGGDVLPLLEHLVDQSLLKVVDTPSGTRFRMLETVREFSAARRDAAGETERVLDGLLAWARDLGVANNDAHLGPAAFSAAEQVRAEQDNLVLALRHALARMDGATVAATAAVLAGLWTVEANYARVMNLNDETAWVLSHYRPAPDLVEVTRTASTLCAMHTFLIQGPRAARSLVTLRRLPPAPPNTLITACAVVLVVASNIRQPDDSALGDLCDSDEPLVAAVANCIASYTAESAGEPDSAVKAARRMLDALGDAATGWVGILAHSRIGELCLQVEQGDDARRHLLVALQLLEEFGPWSDVFGIQWAIALACLHVGAYDEAGRWSELAAQGSGRDTYGSRTFHLGVQAEIHLARGEVAAGLSMWRRAKDLLRENADPLFRMESTGLEPWALQVQAIDVVAHAQHRRLDLVGDVVADLPGMLLAMLADPLDRPPAYLVEFPICGALLLALAMVDLDQGATTSGVRMIALADRFHFFREFQPTMSSARARRTAEQADRSAYEDAVSLYADLSHDELRASALAMIESR